MAKIIKEIKTALPNLKSKKVEEISEELDNILAIKKLFTSDGGKILLGVLKNNCSLALRKAVISAKKADKEELVSNVLEYSANLDLLSTLQDISLEEELRNQLDDAVLEALG